MSKYNKTILTSAGLDLAARASSGKAKFTITRAATSTEKLADKSISELQQLTALPSLMQYGEINNVADSAQDKSIVIGTELIFNNKDLSTSYNINTIGLYAKEDGSDKEFLYALTTAVEPETMPDFKDKVLFKFNLTMFVVVGQTDNVSVNVTQNGVVTQEQLAKAVQALPQKQDIININNAVDKINNTINNLGKVKKVQGKEPDAEGNVDITFGKIIKGWDMSNNTYDPSQTKNNDSISNIWPVDQMVIAQVVSKLFSTETSLKSEIAKKDNTADVDDKLSNIHTIANPIEVDNKTNPDSLTEPGFYFARNGFNFAKNDIPNGYRSDGKSYMSVLEGENPGYTLNYFQQFMFQATKFNFECWYRAGYKYGSNAYYTVSFVNLKDIFGKLKQISLNGNTAINPDDDGVINLNVVTKVNDTDPDSNGNVNLSSFEKPNFVYTKKDTLDVDKATTPGIYSLMDTSLTSSINKDALSAVPGNTDGKTYTGYLVVYKHDAANITQELRIYTGRSVPDFTTSTRCIYGTSNYRPNFQRLITDYDYKNIMGYVDSKEVVHQCDDLDSGIAYSKAHPNVFVATP